MGLVMESLAVLLTERHCNATPYRHHSSLFPGYQVEHVQTFARLLVKLTFMISDSGQRALTKIKADLPLSNGGALDSKHFSSTARKRDLAIDIIVTKHWQP